MTKPHHHAPTERHPHWAFLVALGAALLLPVVEWLDDLTEWERVWRAAQAVIVALAAAVVVIALLASCKPDSNPPGPLPGGTEVTVTGGQVRP